MSGYYAHVRDCLEAGRNGRFCAGAEKAAAEISRLTAENERQNRICAEYSAAQESLDGALKKALFRVTSLEAALAERDKQLEELDEFIEHRQR